MKANVEYEQRLIEKLHRFFEARGIGQYYDFKNLSKNSRTGLQQLLEDCGYLVPTEVLTSAASLEELVAAVNKMQFQDENRIYDCLIIGAGQAGLTLARMLQGRYRYLVLERGQIGNAWDNRLQGMTLFTSGQFCGLPGMQFPGRREAFPACPAVASYLRDYAKHNELAVQTQAEVVSLQVEKGMFLATLADGSSCKARAVVNCTGSNQKAFVPPSAEKLDKSVLQFAAESLTSLNLIPEGAKVAVIGDGASGRQIAGRLSSRNKIILATGKKRALLPNRIFGRDVFWWLNGLKLLQQDKNSRIARVMQRRNPVPCKEYNNYNLKKRNITIKPAFDSPAGKTLLFADGTIEEVDVVVWCLGYQDDTSWLKIPQCKNESGFVEEYGSTPCPGLFVLGRKWLSCRASELILGIEKDAMRICAKLEAHLSQVLT